MAPRARVHHDASSFVGRIVDDRGLAVIVELVLEGIGAIFSDHLLSR